jgi:hypothetical protein
MTESAPVPTGRLKTVRRDWEYRPGFVMTPLREIAFNSRLTKQARLVWMWLASVPVRPTRISWGECETMLDCGTKARRSCIAQLVTEGYISVHDDGTVIMHDPYEVYDKKRSQVLKEIRTEWLEYTESPIDNQADNIKEMTLLEKRIDLDLKEFKLEPPTEEIKEPKTKSEQKTQSQVIINSWNKCKPETYSSIRSISIKQQESISKHLKNLGLTTAETESFICSVCAGLKKSQFWSQQVYKTSRNFNSVFGYGNPQDTKMKNVENLYSEGLENEEKIHQTTETLYDNEQQELIHTYKYINLNYTNAKVREDEPETARWYAHLVDILQQLQDQSVDIEKI